MRACAWARHPSAEVGRGKGTPPPVNGWPRGTGTTRMAPRGRRGAAPRGRGGDSGGSPPTPLPCPPSPPPWPVGGRGPTRETAAPQSPQEAVAPRGETPQPRRTQPRIKRPRSAARSLPHNPLPAGGSPPTPWAATERCAPGDTRTMRPALMPAWGRPGGRS